MAASPFEKMLTEGLFNYAILFVITEHSYQNEGVFFIYN